MTKEHYKMIARNIARGVDEGMPFCPPDAISASELAHNLADELQADNPRFDRDRFLRACGI